jgi:brefeldin A-inhibited guanine nucleotide-exchange protein
MRALRQVLASLHASIVEPMVHRSTLEEEEDEENKEDTANKQETNTKSSEGNGQNSEATPTSSEPEKQSLVQIYDSKKKRREEESEATLRFNQKPAAGITYAAKCGHVDGSDATDVARFLLKNKDRFEKTQIGEYLGREPDYQKGFSLRVLHEYVNNMDFAGLMFDDAIRFYLSGFRLPGEAQKVRQKSWGFFLLFLMFRTSL